MTKMCRGSDAKDAESKRHQDTAARRMIRVFNTWSLLSESLEPPEILQQSSFILARETAENSLEQPIFGIRA
jgi:hypothetical protein